MKTIKVTNEVYEEIKRRAKDEGWTIERYVNMLLDSYLRTEQRKDGTLYQ